MAIPGLPTIDNLSGEDMAKAILEMAVGRRPQNMQFDMNGDGELSSADAYNYLKQFKKAAAPQPTAPQPLMQNPQIQAGLNQYNPVNTQAFQDQQQRVGQARTSMDMTSEVLTPPIPLPSVYTPPPIDMTGRMTMAEAKAARMAELGLPYQPEPVSNLTPDQMGQQMQQQAADYKSINPVQPTASTEEMLARAEAEGLNAAMGPVNDTSGFLSDFTGQEAIRQSQPPINTGLGTTPTASILSSPEFLPQTPLTQPLLSPNQPINQPVRQPYDNYAVQQKMAEQNALRYSPQFEGIKPFNPVEQQLQAQQLRFQQRQQQPFQPFQTSDFYQQSFFPAPINQQNLFGSNNPYASQPAVPFALQQRPANSFSPFSPRSSPFSIFSSPFGQQSNTQVQPGQQGGQMNTAPAPRSMAGGIL